MSRKKTLMLFCWLASTFGFGEETTKFSLTDINKDINIAASNPEQLFEASPKIILDQIGTIFLQLPSNNLQIEIAYPVEESNFKEVFGSRP